MTFKPIDAKRDEFRKYLERTGVLEAISKVFIKLIHSSDRPENAIDFICANLGSTLHENDQIESLQQNLEESKDEIAQLKQIIENLKSDKKFTSMNDQSLQEEQESIEDLNNQNTLSDNENIENQMAGIKLPDTSSNLSEQVSNDEESINISNSNIDETISYDGAEKNTDIQDNEPKDDNVIDKVTDGELPNKTDANIE